MHTLRALTIAAALALFTTACSNEDMVVEEQPSETPAVKASVEAPVYHFSIPASFSSGGQTRAMEIGEDNIIHRFATDDKVYVYIQRADDDGDGLATIAVAHDGIKTATYLVPAEIDGAKCTLEGELRFYCNDDDNDDGDRFVPFEPAVDDVVYMFYNMNSPVEDSSGNLHLSYYDYTFQNGSKDHDIYGQFGDTEFLMSRGAAKHDFAMAKMKVTGVDGNGTDGYSLSMVQYKDGTKSDVHFENLAAMVRQRLTFTNEVGVEIDIPDIVELTIRFEGRDYFIRYIWPLNPSGPYYVAPKLSISDPVISAEGDVYLALPINDDNSNLPLVLEAQDREGNLYSVTKAAPEGGFQNSKYYYGSAKLTLQKSI